jgi:sugar/nucleoside kinase (ribokinase family)
MSLLAVGSVAFDDLETPSGKRDHVLGGSATFFALSASHFHPVRVLAVVGEDFGPEHYRTLQRPNVDLEGLTRSHGECFRWRGAYGSDLNTATTLETRLNVFADFRPVLPAGYQDATHVFLGNIDPALQLEVIRQLKRPPRWIALDTMNYWIEGARQALLAVLKEVHILLVNEAEARALTGERNLLKAYRCIQDLGPSILVVKRGEYGVLLLCPEGAFVLPAFPLENVVDPTGAGDTFAGGFLGRLASLGRSDRAALKPAAATGVVMASFTVEKFGTENLESLTEYDIKKRMEAFSDMIRLDGL